MLVWVKSGESIEQSYTVNRKLGKQQHSDKVPYSIQVVWVYNAGNVCMMILTKIKNSNSVTIDCM